MALILGAVLWIQASHAATVRRGAAPAPADEESVAAD